LDLAIRVGIVVRETSAWITVPSRVVCDYAKRRRRRFGEPVHLAAKNDLCLNGAVLQGVVVEGLEYDSIAGSG
jgi:hypothetical protein